MTEVNTLEKPVAAQKPEGSSCSTDKSMKTDAEKGSCSTQHKQGSCGSKG